MHNFRKVKVKMKIQLESRKYAHLRDRNDREMSDDDI